MGIRTCMPRTSGFAPTSTAPSANTWVAGTYDAAPGQVNAVAATADLFLITGVVVLPGIEAPSAARSPLIMRPFDQELVTCQRYYYKIHADLSNYVAFATGYIAPSTQLNAYLAYPTTMRAPPTFNYGGNIAAFTGSLFPVTAIANSYLGRSSALLQLTISGSPANGAAANLVTNADVNAFLAFNASL